MLEHEAQTPSPVPAVSAVPAAAPSLLSTRTVPGPPRAPKPPDFLPAPLYCSLSHPFMLVPTLSFSSHSPLPPHCLHIYRDAALAGLGRAPPSFCPLPGAACRPAPQPPSPAAAQRTDPDPAPAERRRRCLLSPGSRRARRAGKALARCAGAGDGDSQSAPS